MQPLLIGTFNELKRRRQLKKSPLWKSAQDIYPPFQVQHTFNSSICALAQVGVCSTFLYSKSFQLFQILHPTNPNAFRRVAELSDKLWTLNKLINFKEVDKFSIFKATAQFSLHHNEKTTEKQ